MTFKSVNPHLFFSRNDPHDPRWGELVAPLLPSALSRGDLPHNIDEQKLAEEKKNELTNRQARFSCDQDSNRFVLAGYPDDEGIRLSGGRPGAAHAPDKIRGYLYRMTPQLLFPSGAQTSTALWDLGNLDIDSGDLAQRHQVAMSWSLLALNQNFRWIGLGGGHDYGFPDAAAFIEWCQGQAVRPLVLNFDAHLDVRSSEKGLSSGTPFFRMLEKYAEVDFAEIGIQGHCNSRSHFEWARAKGARILSQEEVDISNESLSVQVFRLLEDWMIRPRSVFLSVDIDGFCNMSAPGCSQSWATGFSVLEFFRCLSMIKKRLDIRSLGIYEVSPPLDQDDHTSKLAAQIIHRVLESV